MATIPARHHDRDDLNSADDMRTIGPVMMVVSAAVAILVIMAIVYSPRMWGIQAFGSDLPGDGQADHAAVQGDAGH